MPADIHKTNKLMLLQQLAATPERRIRSDFLNQNQQQSIRKPNLSAAPAIFNPSASSKVRTVTDFGLWEGGFNFLIKRFIYHYFWIEAGTSKKRDLKLTAQKQISGRKYSG